MRTLITAALLALGCGGEAGGGDSDHWFSTRSETELVQWNSDLAFNAGLSSWVSVGAFATGPGIWIGQGADWHYAGHGFSSNVSSVAADDSVVIVALDVNGPWKVFATADGSSWQAHTVDGAFGMIRGLHRAPGGFVAGGHGAIAHSADGSSWQLAATDSLPSLTWKRFASDEHGVTVATPTEPTSVVARFDGQYWIPASLPSELEIVGVTHALGAFFAVSAGGQLLRSDAGESWSFDEHSFTEGRAVDIAGSPDAIVVLLLDAPGSWRAAHSFDVQGWSEESFAEPGHQPERLAYSAAADQFAMSSNGAVWLTDSRRR